jgi:L-amino acid N-acyltransferase YncA
LIIRLAQPRDAPALAAIYNHHILHGLGTFEETPIPAEEMVGRMASVVARGLPYLAAEDGGRVIGYAYAGPFRLRVAYRYTVEDSVYIAQDAMGRGVGKALLGRLIADCEAIGLRQMLAVIGDSGNAGSIALHRALGFEPLGAAQGVGFKHNRWVDIVWMQRALNGGATTAPSRPGLALDGA